jgi:uncharacterized protein (TIGR02145 family)
VRIDKQIWLAENLNYTLGSSKVPSTSTGKLYNWEQALEACPPGWHLPSIEEWQELIEFTGGIANAGKKLKAKMGWNYGEYFNCNGTDSYGFAALPYSENGSMSYCSLWSVSEKDSEAFVVTIKSDNSINTEYAGKRDCRKFVRCVKDA